MEYKIIYSKRKTVTISIVDCVPVIKAPIGTDSATIDKIVEKYSAWIQKHVEHQRSKMDMMSDLTPEKIKELKKSAKKYFADKVQYYSDIMGLKYGRITITSAQKRFGSCSSAGNISFSYRLMLYPEAAREYVIVHELAHLKEMNHSPRFYAIVASVLPDYKYRKRLLK